MIPSLLISMLLLSEMPVPQAIEYTGDVFPESAGWLRVERNCPSERWLENGWFVQSATVPHDPCDEQDDFYERSLLDFSGAPLVVAEWRVKTDGPREEIVEVAPAVFVLGGTRGVRYHTTIAEDRARLIWDVRFPSTFVDLEPDTAHVFRLSIFGEEWFEWSVDGKVHVAASYARPYPTDDSVVVWGNRSVSYSNTTYWDYIRIFEPEPSSVDCDAVERLKARCKGDKLIGKIFTTLERGTRLLVTNNGEHQTAKVRRSGKARVKYDAQPGERTLLLLDCPAVSDVAECD